MDAAGLRAELEAEWAWRADELRFLRNQLGLLSSEDERGVYRKSLLVMLYSHFEGACRTSFAVYVQALNAENPALHDVNSALVASGLAELFGELRNAERKSLVFRATAPDDSGLHRYARDREFVERWSEFLGTGLTLDPDRIVDTESNLKPVVIRKIMFRLGLDHEPVDAWAGTIDHLLRRRNAVAHGTHRQGIGESVYLELETAVFDLVSAVNRTIFEAVVRRAHLKAGTASG